MPCWLVCPFDIDPTIGWNMSRSRPRGGQKRMPSLRLGVDSAQGTHVIVSEFGNLLPVDPHGPKDDDEECEGSSDGPEDPELVGYDKAIALVGCGPVERADAEDGLLRISSVITATNGNFHSAQISRLVVVSTTLVDGDEWVGRVKAKGTYRECCCRQKDRCDKCKTFHS
jgi:hypothetical protein